MNQMERQEKIELIMEHVEDPCNYGKLDPADIIQPFGNPGCGDVVTLYLRIGEDEVINDIRFEGEGCSISQAGTSMITEIVKGKTLKEIEEMPASVIIDELGKELAMTRPRCSTLGIDCAKSAVRSYRKKKMQESITAGETAKA